MSEPIESILRLARDESPDSPEIAQDLLLKYREDVHVLDEITQTLLSEFERSSRNPRFRSRIVFVFGLAIWTRGEVSIAVARRVFELIDGEEFSDLERAELLDAISWPSERYDDTTRDMLIRGIERVLPSLPYTLHRREQIVRNLHMLRGDVPQF